MAEIIKLDPDKLQQMATARAREARAYYEAFVAAGFTPEQAWSLVQGKDWMDEVLK